MARDAYLEARLGAEPFTAAFTAPYLRQAARGRRAPVKAFLLDQRRVAGVGNIYADEALFRAGIHPLRPAGALTAAQWARVHTAIEEVLTAGIDSQGATIDDFRHLDGARGSFQDRFLVHRRAGEPCPVCGRPVRKIVAAGRGTYVCERCQKRPEGPPGDGPSRLPLILSPLGRAAGPFLSAGQDPLTPGPCPMSPVEPVCQHPSIR